MKATGDKHRNRPTAQTIACPRSMQTTRQTYDLHQPPHEQGTWQPWMVCWSNHGNNEAVAARGLVIVNLVQHTEIFD